MEGSRTPLNKWLQAIFLITSQYGVNAVQLSQLIGVTYKTAWLMLHKLRHAMNFAESKKRLEGIVRVEPGVYGKPYNPTGFRHPQEHPVIAGASYDDEGRIQAIKVKQVAPLYISADSKIIIRSGYDNFVAEAVHPLATKFIVNRRLPHTARCSYIMQVCRQANKRLNALFKGIGAKHLQAYFDEFCFIHNHSGKRTHSPNVDTAPFYEGNLDYSANTDSIRDHAETFDSIHNPSARLVSVRNHAETFDSVHNPSAKLVSVRNRSANIDSIVDRLLGFYLSAPPLTGKSLTLRILPSVKTRYNAIAS